MNRLPPSKEEIQLEKILQQATLKYGDVENKIEELKKTLSVTPPRYVPPGAQGKDQKSDKIREEIKALQKNQREIVAEVLAKTNGLCKDASPEVKEKLMQRTDTWAKADIAAKAREEEKKIEPELTEAQERFLKKFEKSEEKRDDLTEEQERFLKKLDRSEERQKTSDKKQADKEPAKASEKEQAALENSTEKTQKAIEFRDNRQEITNAEEGKKAAAEQERQKQIEELRQKFAQNRELYKERDR